jgi:hypothetical protein
LIKYGKADVADRAARDCSRLFGITPAQQVRIAPQQRREKAG